jgi:putative ABC transport system ATP-binding protein
MAVALANRPELLLADEPTGALDRKSSMQVIELLQRLRERYGLTILMVTHDMEIAQCADRVLTLRDGALGQNLTGEDDAPRLDDAGRIRLPEPVQATLKEAHRIAVEIRPEGVLLRPEAEASDDTSAILQEMLPQDAPPVKRGLFRRKKNTAKAK